MQVRCHNPFTGIRRGSGSLGNRSESFSPAVEVVVTQVPAHFTARSRNPDPYPDSLFVTGGFDSAVMLFHDPFDEC